MIEHKNVRSRNGRTYTKYYNSLTDRLREIEKNDPNAKKGAGFDSVSFARFLYAVKAIARYNGHFELLEVFNRFYKPNLDVDQQDATREELRRVFDQEWLDGEIVRLQALFDEIVKTKSFVYEPSKRSKREANKNMRLCLFFVHLVTLRFLGFRQQLIRNCTLGENVFFKNRNEIQFYWTRFQVKNIVEYYVPINNFESDSIHDLVVKTLQTYYQRIYPHILKNYDEPLKDQLFVVLKANGKFRRINKEEGSAYSHTFANWSLEFLEFGERLEKHPRGLKPHLLRHICANWLFSLGLDDKEVGAALGDSAKVINKNYRSRRSVNCVWATVNHTGSTGALAVARTMNALVLRPTLIVETSWRQQIYYSVGKSLAGSSGLVAWEKLMLKLRSHLTDRSSVALEDFVTLLGSLVPSGNNVFERAVICPDSSHTIYSFEEIEDALDRLPPVPAANRLVGRASATNIRELPEASRAKRFESTNREAVGPKQAIHQTSFAGDGGNASEAGLPPGYELADDGSVWHVAAATARKEPKRTFVSFAPLRISQIRENSETGLIKIVLAYSYLGRRRAVTVTRAQMCNARQLTQILAAAGAPVSSNNARQTVAYLSAYEQAFAETIPRKTMIDRFGRGNNVGTTEFFLPGLSANSEFEPRNSGDAQLFDAFAARSGSLAEWVRNVNILADEALIVPQIAVLAAFVPPLQKMLQIPNFILDLHGATCTGKSTALRLAASVFGKPRDPGSLVMQWMNTKTAIEQGAGLCSELPIFLDDAQHCPRQLVGSVVYMIANGKGATRAIGGAGGIRDAASWHTIALSTSETPLREIARHEGAQSRILPLGGETPPFPFGSAALVGRLDRAAAENYGYACEAYIRHLNGWTDSDWLMRRQRYLQIQAGLVFDFKTNLLGRVAAYVAAVQIAAEIAAPLLGLRFEPESIASWLALRLEENEQTQNVVFAALRLLADYYMAHPETFTGASEFSLDLQSEIKGAVRLQHYVGFTRQLFAQIFDGRRWNLNIILAKLAGADALLATEKNRFTKKISVENRSYRMICVKWSSLF